MSPQDPQAAALLAHVVSQIEQNVNFLASQNYLSQSDAATILTKLPKVTNDAPGVVVNGVANMTVATATARAVPPPPRPNDTASHEQNESSLPRARAIWAYSGGDPDDLQFDAGDVIEIVEELNADWYKGRLNGKEGLVPVSYVEKIASVGRSSKPYKPFGAAYHGLAFPPPSGQGTNDAGLQENPGQEEKKSKLAGYKNTLAHSAVGGVGFGAGTAIGGGLVRAIF